MPLDHPRIGMAKVSCDHHQRCAVQACRPFRSWSVARSSSLGTFICSSLKAARAVAFRRGSGVRSTERCGTAIGAARPASRPHSTVAWALLRSRMFAGRASTSHRSASELVKPILDWMPPSNRAMSRRVRCFAPSDAERTRASASLMNASTSFSVAAWRSTEATVARGGGTKLAGVGTPQRQRRLARRAGRASDLASRRRSALRCRSAGRGGRCRDRRDSV